jgi:hypothetical protein
MPVIPGVRVAVSYEVRDEMRWGNLWRRGDWDRTEHAILDEDVQALLDGKGGVEDDQSEAEGEDVVGVSRLKEVANGTLFIC